MNQVYMDTGVFILAYFLSGFNAGYYVVRWKTGKDIREHYSQATGAKNVGRVLGKRGFYVTFFGDFFKGYFLIFLASSILVEPQFVPWILIALILGHVYPCQLNFKGGKGIAVFMGGAIANLRGFNFIASYPSLIVCLLLIFWAHRKNFKRNSFTLNP